MPQDEAKGQSLVDLAKKYTAFYEKYLGPYPFRADKIGIAETPHLGMEHQTITAYGNGFKYNADGDDWLLFHEFGHEWWANLVTAPDWNDFWIHEGFQSFMDTFYIETTKGQRSIFRRDEESLSRSAQRQTRCAARSRRRRRRFICCRPITRNPTAIFTAKAR